MRSLSPLAPLALSFTLISCGGGGGGSATDPAVNGTFKIQTGVKSAAQLVSRSRLSAGARTEGMLAIDPSSLEFDLAVRAHEGGTLVAGYSHTPDTTLEFSVSTTVDGVTVGSNGVSQTFPPTDPSIIQNALEGPATVPSGNSIGLFMTRFAASDSTVMDVVAKGDASGLPQVDEIVLRTAGSVQPLVDADGHHGTLVTGPHFFAGGVLYSDTTGNLKLNSTSGTAQNFQYIFFLPASRVGAGKSFFVASPNTVISPVTNDYGASTDPSDSSTWSYNDPSLWVPKGTTAWISDPGCAGLAAVIDSIAGTDRSAQSWMNMADYFKVFFTKFYAARSTMFQPNGILGSTYDSATFEIVALDDSNGPMALTGQSTINLIYDPSASVCDLASGILDITGTPPISFSASVAVAP